MSVNINSSPQSQLVINKMTSDIYNKLKNGQISGQSLNENELYFITDEDLINKEYLEDYVSIDNGTITINGTNITPITQVPLATTSSPGKVQIGNNITVNNGTISVPTASSSDLGVIKVASTNNYLKIENGTLDVKTGSTGLATKQDISGIAGGLTCVGAVNKYVENNQDSSNFWKILYDENYQNGWLFIVTDSFNIPNFGFCQNGDYIICIGTEEKGFFPDDINTNWTGADWIIVQGNIAGFREVTIGSFSFYGIAPVNENTGIPDTSPIDIPIYDGD